MQATLDQIRRAPSVLDVIALTDRLEAEAVQEALVSSAGAEATRRALLAAARDGADAPTAIAAVHALVRLPGRRDDDLLAELLGAGGWLAPHAAWSLADRHPAEPLVGPLVAQVRAGRLGGMLAQRTLARWAAGAPELVVRAVAAHLARTTEPPARARLVETLGVVGSIGERVGLDTGPQSSAAALARIAADRDEPSEVRVAAVAALGDRAAVGHRDPATDRLLAILVAGDDAVADAARLAIFDGRRDREALVSRDAADRSRRDPDGLRIAQVHLGGHLDRALAHAGMGDTGGIATLLVQLGDALAADSRVDEVTTIGRGPGAEAFASLATAGASHAVVAAPLGSHEDVSFAGSWPAVVAAERGLRRILDHRPPTLLHLRMADVGSLAAARIARRRGLPIVFTLAPDPHAVIAEMERTGELDRASFGPADGRGALWFRARLVRRLADLAQQVALFPRPELAARFRRLLGIDVEAEPQRYHVVPEGIEPGPVRAARAEITRNCTADRRRDPTPAGTRDDLRSVLVDLLEGIAALGPERQGLPLVVSVGRLAEMKGMARLVDAFAADPDLRGRANLVIVGGDLANPTPEERDEIARIEGVLARHPEMEKGIAMLGHRPHDDVLRVMAAAEVGLAPGISPGGAYVCASRKEEFGLAIVEALVVGRPSRLDGRHVDGR